MPNPTENPYRLKKTVNKEQIRFYLKSCKYFRFPFFDSRNCYRRDGLFSLLEETLVGIGEHLSREFGANFVSINLRGSWLRGIPIRGDDVDVLFIVSGLGEEDRRRIQDYTRARLLDADQLFQMCAGKITKGVHVEPIVFLDVTDLGMIMNRYMYGLSQFLRGQQLKQRDEYQEAFFGSKLTEKKSQFLKSGILIPYVGWVYGRERKREVFDEIGNYLPVPTYPTRLYKEPEIDEAKETIRQAFIARNLIYPSMEIKKWIDLKNIEADDLKEEALELYSSLESLEDVHARAVINYIYTLKIEEEFLGKIVTRERIRMFAPSYDQLVYDILEMAYLRLATPSPKH